MHWSQVTSKFPLEPLWLCPRQNHSTLDRFTRSLNSPTGELWSINSLHPPPLRIIFKCALLRLHLDFPHGWSLSVVIFTYFSMAMPPTGQVANAMPWRQLLLVWVVLLVVRALIVWMWQHPLAKLYDRVPSQWSFFVLQFYSVNHVSWTHKF